MERLGGFAPGWKREKMAAMRWETGCRRSLVVMAVVALLAGASCGSDARALSREDVTGLPPGNAVGSTFSGSYLVESGVITSCHCRIGSCAGITANSGSVATVVQQDGMLTFIDANGAPAVGGINADGTFSVGSVLEQPGATVYARMDGTFVLVNGLPDSADFTAMSTDIVNMTGLRFDCDLTVAGSLRYQGP